jgi:hypothetical protein
MLSFRYHLNVIWHCFVCIFYSSKALYYMNQPGWRPHQKGSSPTQDWTPADWREFSLAAQFFTQRRSAKPRNKGRKRIQWWQDRKEGRDPRARKHQRVEAETQAEPAEETLAAPPSEAGISNDEPAPPSAAVVSDDTTAYTPPKAAPKPSSMVILKARPGQPPPLPKAAPRYISPWGDQPGFVFHMVQARSIWVPKALAEQAIHGMRQQECFAKMSAIFPDPKAVPTAFHTALRNPIYIDESDDDYIPPVIRNLTYPSIEEMEDMDEDAPTTGGSSSSTFRPDVR